jgi:hypothetical protein
LGEEFGIGDGLDYGEDKLLKAAVGDEEVLGFVDEEFLVLASENV